jgi:hypothetical protein
MDILKSSMMTKLSTEDRNAFKVKWEAINNLFIVVDNLIFEDMLNTFLYYKLGANPNYRYDKELLTIFDIEKKNSLEAIYEIEEFAKAYIEAINSNDKNIYLLRYLQHRIYWHSIIATAKYVKYENYSELLNILVAYYYQNWIAGATVARIKQASFNIIKAVKANKPVDEIKTFCNSNLIQYYTTGTFRDEIAGSYIYGRKWDKPLLLLLEYFSQDESKINFIALSKSLQIEHILPQNPNKENSDWKEIFSESEMESLTNSLGNLTLLSMRKNVQALNYSFHVKKEAYKDKDNVVTSFYITQTVLKNDKWTVKTINERANDFVKIITKKLDIF